MNIIILRCLFVQVMFLHTGCIVMAAEGECDPEDINGGSSSCVALSLMQRHARMTLNSKTAEAKSSFHDSEEQTQMTKASQKASALSHPSHKIDSPVVDLVGPVPLSLLAFSTDIHVTDHRSLLQKFSSAARTRDGFLYIVIPLAVLIVICIFLVVGYTSMGSGAKAGEAAGVIKTTSPHRSPQPGVMGTNGFPTQSSLASTSSSLVAQQRAAMLTPMNPSLIPPSVQQPKMPVCLLFPTRAADVRVKSSSFEVFWGDLSAPFFRVNVTSGSEADRLELYDCQNGERLCATCDLNARSAPVDETPHWLVTNKELKAHTRGLAYRSAQEESKIRNAVAGWGTIIPGVATEDDRGRKWLKVGEWFLPMVVDGHDVIQEVSPADVPQRASGLQIMRPDGMIFATLKPIDGGQYNLVRNDQMVCRVSINSGGHLVEAKIPTGRLVASIAKEQIRLPNGDMMLELVVEPQLDPVLMLIGYIAVLRQLPAHQE